MVRAIFNLENLHNLKRKTVMKMNLVSRDDPVIKARYQTNVEMNLMNEEENRQ